MRSYKWIRAHVYSPSKTQDDNYEFFEAFPCFSFNDKEGW